MEKIYRFIGKRGRITIPYELRMQMGFRRNDLVSFTREGNAVVVKREKICDNCIDRDAERVDEAISEASLHNFLSSLPLEAQKSALLYLSDGLAKEVQRG